MLLTAADATMPKQVVDVLNKSGNRPRGVGARRMTSGEVSKYLKGLGFGMREGYGAPGVR